MKTNNLDQMEHSGELVPLNTINAEKLLATPLPPMKFYVEGILPQGLHVLAGNPKAGKSWLALWLCLQIASGKSVWERPVIKADVLYLSLEDSAIRLQNRITALTEKAPPSLHLAVSSNALGEGLEEQLEAFLLERPDTGLIVIDTLQKAKNGREKQNSGSYAGDYRALSRLKEMADRYGIAILLIHHLRKSRADDPFEQISGSTGITGAVDTSYVLSWHDRHAGTAFLHMSGRDVEYGVHYLQLDGNVWEYIGEAGTSQEDEATLSDFVERVKMVVNTGGGWKGTASELLLVTACHSYSINYVTKLLKASRERLQAEGIEFRYGKSNGRRYICFTLTDGKVSDRSEENKVIEFPQIE